jgi:hypothetical protein
MSPVTDTAALDARIAEATGRVRERARLASRLTELDRALAEREAAISVLVATAAREDRDVARLTGLTLDRVLAALRGSRDDDLARERAEAGAAAYRLADERARRDLVLRERDGIQARHRSLSAAEGELAAALAAKEEHLRSAPDDPRSAGLTDLATQRGVLDAEVREVDEAMAAAAAAGQALRQVEESLGSAGSWSTYDTWFGGGAIGSYVKHDRLDQAQRAASRADESLAALRRELADVGGGGAVVPSLEMSGLTRFLDIWFDNIFTDLSVSSRIKDAKATTADAQRAVASVQRSLLDRRNALGARADDLSRQRTELLSGA